MSKCRMRNVLAVLQLFTECQNRRVGFVWRIFEADDDLAHRHFRVVPTLGGQVEDLPMKILRPPGVVEDLYEIGALPDVVGHSGTVSDNLAVLAQANRDQQDLPRHRLAGIHFADGRPAGILLAHQISGCGEINAIHVESVDNHVWPLFMIRRTFHRSLYAI